MNVFFSKSPFVSLVSFFPFPNLSYWFNPDWLFFLQWLYPPLFSSSPGPTMSQLWIPMLYSDISTSPHFPLNLLLFWLSLTRPPSLRLSVPRLSLCRPRLRHMAHPSPLLSSINTVVSGNYRHAQHTMLYCSCGNVDSTTRQGTMLDILC